MSNDDFPTDYDAIVLGTGMSECIIAAALSRIGQKVLHMDRNDYYSGDWACFHLEALLKWISKHKDEVNMDKLDIKDNTDPASLLEEGERLLPLQVESSSVKSLTENICIPESPSLPSLSELASSCYNQQQQQQQQQRQNTPPDGAKQTSSQDVPQAEQVAMTVNENAKEEEKKEEEKKEEEKKEEELKEEKKWTMQDLKSQWRKFNIDLVPKVLFCRGSMVELLISSDVAKYCEFKTVSRVLTLINNKLEQVPCSRSDVFSSKQVSVIEKRMMMKFLTFAMDYEKHPEEYQGKEDTLFNDFLKSKKMTGNVHHYISQAIAMSTDTTTTMEGLACTKKFLQSLGRYGNTAFLWPVYGAGELPQCFCRMCAVFGGIYCLRRTGHSMIVNTENSCVGLVDTEGKRLKTKWLVMDASYADKQSVQNGEDRWLSRGILVTDRSILGDSEENITLLSLPTGDGRNITLHELGSSAYASPKDLYVIQLTCQGKAENPQEDFAAAMDKLFQKEDSDSLPGISRPKILWSVFFSIADSSKVQLKPEMPDNIFLVAGPDAQLDFDQSIAQAREIFEKICPGEEFLPKAPNPEDIIWDDGEGNQPKESGFESKDDDEQKGPEEVKTEHDQTDKGNQSEQTETNVESVKVEQYDEHGSASNTKEVEGETTENKNIPV